MRFRLRMIVMIGIPLILVIAGIWFFVAGRADNNMGAGGLPLIKADTNPVKLPPDDPGGEIMPNADSTVFSAMGNKVEADPSLTNIKTPQIPAAEVTSSSVDFAGLKTGFSVPQEPEKKTESLFAATTAPAEEATPQPAPIENPASKYVSGIAPEALTQTPAAEPTPALETEPVVEAPVTEEAATTAEEAPAATMPVPSRKPARESTDVEKPVEEKTPAPVINPNASAAQNLEAQEKMAVNPAPAPSPEDTVAQDVANEAYTPKTPAKPPVEAKAEPGEKAYFIQLASTSSSEEAKGLWGKLQKKYPQALSGLTPSYKTAVVAGRGEYIRIQAGPMSRDQANERCKSLHAINPNGGCLVFHR